MSYKTEHTERMVTRCICNNCDNELYFDMEVSDMERTIRIGICSCMETLQDELELHADRIKRQEETIDHLLKRIQLWEENNASCHER